MIEFRFRGDAELERMADRVEAAPRRLQRELSSGLAAAARPAAQDVRREIRGVPMGQRRTWTARSQRRAGGRLGRGSSPLRTAVASAVEVQTRGMQVEIRLRDTQVPVRARWFVPYVTGRKARLRHPFMGNRRLWVQATGNMDRWWPVLRRHLPRFARERDQAVDRVARRL